MTNSRRRRGLAAASALLGGVLVLSACSGGDDDASGTKGKDTSQAKADEAAAKKSSEADIKITPRDGSDNASINNSAAVTVSKGTLTNVTMKTADGEAKMRFADSWVLRDGKIAIHFAGMVQHPDGSLA